MVRSGGEALRMLLCLGQGLPLQDAESFVFLVGAGAFCHPVPVFPSHSWKFLYTDLFHLIP